MGWRNAAAWLGSCLHTPGEDQGITSLHPHIHITLSILATTSRDQGAMTPPRLRGITAPKYKLSHTYNEPDKGVTQIDTNICRGTEAAGWGDEGWCWCLGNCRGAVTGEER